MLSVTNNYAIDLLIMTVSSTYSCVQIEFNHIFFSCSFLSAIHLAFSFFRKWTILCICIFMLIIILIVLSIGIWFRYTEKQDSKKLHFHLIGNHFDDLNGKEIELLRNHITKQLSLVDIEIATVNDDYLFSIRLLEPKKYLPSPRSAIATVFHGNQTLPSVLEYTIGPLQKIDTKLELSRWLGWTIPFYKRPLSIPEIKVLKSMIHRFLKQIAPVVWRDYKRVPDFHDLGNSFFENTPVPVDGKKRVTWFRVFQFQLRILHDGVDINTWKIQKIRLLGKEYDSIKDLLDSVSANQTIQFSLRCKVKDVQNSFWLPNVFSAPQVKANGNLSMGPWKMKVAFRSETGLRIFKITFRERPVLYELGLAAAGNVFEGASLDKYLYSVLSSESIGARVNLKPKVHCPLEAVYFSGWVTTEGRARYVDHLSCAFSSLTTTSRHTEFGLGTYTTFESRRDWFLTIRSVSSIYKSDYVFDFKFYVTGVIELKVWIFGLVNTCVNADETLFTMQAPIHFLVFKYKADFEFDKSAQDSIHMQSIIYSDYTINDQVIDKERPLPVSSGANYYLHCSAAKPSSCYRIVNRAEMVSNKSGSSDWEM